jgi:ribosomal protein L28
MAYACDNCGKTVDHGHLVSHAKNRVKTLRRPNLHTAKVVVKGKTMKQLLCTKCLRKADRPHKQATKEVIVPVKTA